MERILVTGGAGFIGSHLVDALVRRGYEVKVLDNLDPQVHGQGQAVPPYLNADAQFIRGDVRDLEAIRKASDDIDVVFHLAATVGVGQSMYEVRRYMEVNTLGSANLLEILANEKHSVKKLIVASSMSVYGEGSYYCEHCSRRVYPDIRPPEQLLAKEWEMRCPSCQRMVSPLPTKEDKPLFPTSMYAVSKRTQEEMFLRFGQAYCIPTIALRYFNVYGPRQSLSNPYTGVTAIFCSRLLNGKAPIIFEDGLQSRDFVHVSDIVQANLLALEGCGAGCQVFNIGTGRPLTISDLARILGEKLGKEDIEPIVAGKHRAGDIRHCYADISSARETLGFTPTVAFERGINDLVEWVKTQKAIDLVELATEELERRALVR